MNKADLVKQVAERAQLDSAAARRAVDAVIDGISERLGAGEDVILTGFGKFSVVQRAEREGVNPREPGTRIRIPARRSARFTPGTQLRSSVAAGPDGQVVLDPIKLMANEPAKIVVPVADDGEEPKKPAARTRKSTAKASDEKSSGSAAKGGATKSPGSSSSTKSSGSSSSTKSAGSSRSTKSSGASSSSSGSSAAKRSGSSAGKASSSSSSSSGSKAKAADKGTASKTTRRSGSRRTKES